MMTNNPFSIIFGKDPSLNIERPIEKSEIVDTFSDEAINQQIYIITSVRGSGKTVLMTEISKYFKQKDNWIVVALNPETNMQDGLLAKLNSQVGTLLKSLNVNLSVFNVLTVGANLENKITDVETAIIKIIEHLKKHNKRILITIDEATNSKNMRVFASMFQILVREDLPVFLLMTGLYENIRNLQNEKSLTFLCRAPRIVLGPLNLRSIQKEYKKVFQLDDENAARMAVLTKGYAFAFQALGFLTYRHDGKYQEAIDDYKLYLEEYSYNKIWSELSNGDKKILKAMAHTDSNSVADILKTLETDVNHFNPYRKRLLAKGVLRSNGRGNIEFALPLFDQYVLENEAFERLQE